MFLRSPCWWRFGCDWPRQTIRQILRLRRSRLHIRRFAWVLRELDRHAHPRAVASRAKSARSFSESMNTFPLSPLDGLLYYYMFTAVSRLGLNVHGVRSSMLFIPRHQPHRDLYRTSLARRRGLLAAILCSVLFLSSVSVFSFHSTGSSPALCARNLPCLIFPARAVASGSHSA
jgi:hypothetical protein